jgi:predicted ATPase
VQGIIKERYESLGKALKKIMDVASVNGYDFNIQIIERILKIDKSDLLEQLAELEKQHRLFVPAPRKNVHGKLYAAYSFTHALVHKYVYDNISEEKRMYLHESVADLLLEMYGTKENMPKDVGEQYENHLRIS